METENKATTTVTDDFKKIMTDFVTDLKLTFEEYNPIINKAFGIKNAPITESNIITDEIFQKMFDYCIKKYPPRFFDILYQNVEIFSEESTDDTEFLPNIHFKNLWNDGITDKTKVTIWKYLQLVLFTVIGKVENRDEFGDSLKLFEAINNDTFRNKLEDTFEEMKVMFDNNDENTSTDDADTKFNIPEADKMHEHLSGILDGKLGSLATEMAEEISSDLNINSDNMNSVNDVFDKLVKDPKNLMSMVNKITNKLESKINSGDINQSELLAEASEIMNQFQHMPGMPGMNNMQEMFSKMGMGINSGGGKMDPKATEAQLQRRLKLAKTKERIRAKAESNKIRKAQEELKQNIMTQTQTQTQKQTPEYTDDEVASFFDLKEDENNPKKPKKSKKNKKQKNKNEKLTIA